MFFIKLNRMFALCSFFQCTMSVQVKSRSNISTPVMHKTGLAASIRIKNTPFCSVWPTQTATSDFLTLRRPSDDVCPISWPVRILRICLTNTWGETTKRNIGLTVSRTDLFWFALLAEPRLRDVAALRIRREEKHHLKTEIKQNWRCRLHFALSVIFGNPSILCSAVISRCQTLWSRSFSLSEMQWKVNRNYETYGTLAAWERAWREAKANKKCKT